MSGDVILEFSESPDGALSETGLSIPVLGIYPFKVGSCSEEEQVGVLCGVVQRDIEYVAPGGQDLHVLSAGIDEVQLRDVVDRHHLMAQRVLRIPVDHIGRPAQGDLIRKGEHGHAKVPEGSPADVEPLVQGTHCLIGALDPSGLPVLVGCRVLEQHLQGVLSDGVLCPGKVCVVCGAVCLQSQVSSLGSSQAPA